LRSNAIRQHEQVSGLGDGRVDRDEDVDPRLGRKGVDVGRVGDARQPDDGHLEPVAGRRGQRGRGAPVTDLEGVLAVEPDVEQPRDDPVEGHAGAVGDLVEPGLEHRGVATELVDDEGLQQGTVLLAEERPRAVERGEDAPAVDVADDDHRQPELASQPHVDVVTRAQVDLRR